VLNILFAGGACGGPSFIGEPIGLVVTEPMLLQAECGGCHLSHVGLDFDGLEELSGSVREVASEFVFVMQCLGQELKGVHHCLTVRN
jgi:hypothetical protein